MPPLTTRERRYYRLYPNLDCCKLGILELS